ncbi:MAG: SufD family Fe-S cluster assembly protein [Ruminococcaceae bacterium]|nr:SufD family Fe-S cluster assembly protein [Oscillospiraceae bacterium]
MDAIQKTLLAQVADLHETPSGAYNIRANGKSAGRASSENIEIRPKADADGIDIIIRPGTKNESVHMPVLLSESGLTETVYNDFYIGEGADVLIVAGCGIHNGGDKESRHDGIHTFHIAKGARLRYVEKHYGQGDGNGKNVMNPTTVIEIDEGGCMEMETVQIKGVDSTDRITRATLAKDATLTVKENLMTHGSQTARTEFEVNMNGENCSAHVISRSVAKDKSHQLFVSRVNGNAPCNGHTECDAIIMDEASVSAVPEITANVPDASLIHEAAIGKIAGEQLMKLMSLGLSEKEAEEQIVNGFLK